MHVSLWTKYNNLITHYQSKSKSNNQLKHFQFENLLMITLNKSKNENPMKSPSDPPTAATIAVKSKRRTSSMMVTSVDKYPSHMEVNNCLDSSSSSSKEKLRLYTRSLKHADRGPHLARQIHLCDPQTFQKMTKL
jgi:hypothetical protein